MKTNLSTLVGRLMPHPKNSARAITGFALLSAIALSGCATNSRAYHDYVMQGQVLSIDGNKMSVCIGEREGAKVGQVLQVVRHVPVTSSSKAANPSFRRESIGKARIESLYDEHYATAVVVEGSPRLNDVVELDAKR